jgi:hypothetical protein
LHLKWIKQRHKPIAIGSRQEPHLPKQGSLLYTVLTFLMYDEVNLVNIRILIELIINPEEEDVIFLNTAKKFNSSAGQCLLGLSFSKP